MQPPRPEPRSRISRRLLAAIALAPLALGALGCSFFSRSLFGGETSVALNADPGINHDSPVAVELVVVFDAGLQAKLAGMSAADWFRNRAQIQSDYPGSTGFVSRSWEIVPGQGVREQSLEFGVGAVGGFVFANYLFSEGPHRQQIDPHQKLQILLRDSNFTVDATD